LEEQKIMCGAKMGNQTLEEYKKNHVGTWESST
jgi:hypothetical protein